MEANVLRDVAHVRVVVVHVNRGVRAVMDVVRGAQVVALILVTDAQVARVAQVVVVAAVNKAVREHMSTTENKRVYVRGVLQVV